MLYEMPNQYWTDREYKYEWDVLYLKCTKCWKWLSLDGFPQDKGRKFWVRSDCKDCHRIKMKKYHRSWYLNNTDEAREYAREYHKNNKDILKNKDRSRIESRMKDLWFDRYSFHGKARYYVRKNNLKPHLCPICWADRDIEIHHPYYNSFNDRSKVVFCCRFCHRNIHLWDLECPQPIDLLTMESNSPIKECSLVV